MSPALLVPVQVDPLAVPPGKAVAASDCARPFAADAPPPFALRSPRAPGVHLHWALPDALCAPGVPIPDRWLVTRLSGGAGGRRRVAAWVLAPTAAGGWDRTPLEEWADDRPSATADASGPGAQPDPTWTAYADNVEGILAMHDPLAGEAGPLAYAVCGWWSSPPADPLAGRVLHDVLRANGWYHRPAVRGADRPDHTVLHGAVIGLDWPAPAVTGAPPPAAGIRLTVGATGEETLARLLTVGATDPLAEEAVTLMLHGMVADLTTPGGPSRADATVHQSGFEASASPAGDDWVPDRPPAETPVASIGATPRPGTLGDVLIRAPGTPVWADPRGGWRRVPRAGPRWFRPATPVLALTGVGRGFRHNADGRFEPDGSLRCRASGETIRALALGGGRAASAEELLEPLVGAAPEGVPEDAGPLVREVALLDTGSAALIAEDTGVDRDRVLAQQRAMWLLRDRRTDREALTRGSGFSGVPPSPVALSLPVDPWAPMHVEWEAEYRPTPGGAGAWEPGEVDLSPPAGPPGPPSTLRGRALLSGGLARMAAAAARPAGGGDLAGAIADLDLLTGTLNGLTEQMAAACGPVRAGTLALTRVRVVDGFGRHVDLPSGTVPAIGASLRHDGQPGVAALPPRLLGDARVVFEFDAGPVRSPVCGFLVPDPLEPALEFAGADGEMLGALRVDEAGTLFWDDRPGLPAFAGRRPADAVADPDLAAIGETLLEWARADEGRDEGILAAALRALDASLWMVNRSGTGGEEHRALLTSQPLVVLRARLGLELRDPPAAAPDAAVRVRLGSVTDRSEGLVAVIRRDRPGRIGLVDAAVLAGDDDEPPVDHPALGPDAEVTLRPGEPPVELILVVCPHTNVSATSGWLPRKSIAMLRDWIAPGLARLTPTLRLGPVLIDPRDVRLPLGPSGDGAWRFARRTAGGGDWEVTSPRSTGEGGGWGRPVVAEGWLTLDRDPEEEA